MALPTQLKAARMTNDTLGLDIDNYVAEIEQALCDIFGFTINTDVTESPFGCDNAGRITKALLRLAAAAPMGIRFRDSAAGVEVAVINDGTNLIFSENTGTEAVPVWGERVRMEISTGLFTFTAIPVGPAADPTTDNQLSRKAYVDSAVAAGVDSVVHKHALIRDQKANGTNGGIATIGAWTARDLNTIIHDPDGIVVSVASNKFTLGIGTYRIRATAPFYSANRARIAIYNVTDGTYKYGVNDMAPYSPGFYASACRAHVEAFVVLAAEKEFQIRYYVENNGGGVSTSLGPSGSWGDYENYTEVEITKIQD